MPSAHADDVVSEKRAIDVELTGLGSATLHASATGTAELRLSGLGSATVHGKPPVRHVRSSGLGDITWR